MKTDTGLGWTARSRAKPWALSDYIVGRDPRDKWLKT